MNETATATETVNSNPAEEAAIEATTETGTAEPTATVAVEPEQYTCCVQDCGHTGTVDGFRVQDFKALIQLVLAARATPSTERAVITPELVAKFATCNECAGKIRDAHGVAYYSLVGALEWSRNFQQKTGAVAAIVGSPTPAPVVDNDPEAQALVACCVCEEQVTRVEAMVIGWWGAKLFANRILGRDGGLATNQETNRMLVNNTGIGDSAEKVPAVCKDCATIARPSLVQAAANLTFVKLMGDQERRMQFERNLRPMSLMTAIRKAREYEAKGAAMAATQEAERAEKEAAEKEAAEKDTRLKAKLEAFLGAAVSKPPRGGRKPPRGGKPQKPGKYGKKDWGNDD